MVRKGDDADNMHEICIVYVFENIKNINQLRVHYTCIVNAHWPVGCPRDTTRQCVSTSSSLEAVRYNPEMFMRKNVWKYTFECSLNTLQTFMYFKFALAHIGRKDALVFVCLCVSACMSVSDCLCICVCLSVCLCVSLFGSLLFVVRTRFVHSSCKEGTSSFPVCLYTIIPYQCAEGDTLCVAHCLTGHKSHKTGGGGLW